MATTGTRPGSIPSKLNPSPNPFRTETGQKRRSYRRPAKRSRKDRREARRLRYGKFVRALAEMNFRRSRDSEGTLSPLRDIEVYFEDPLFPQNQLHKRRENGFGRLAPVGPPRAEEEVLDDLHRKRAPPLFAGPGAAVPSPAFPNPSPIDAMVSPKTGIYANNDRFFRHGRQVRPRQPALVNPVGPTLVRGLLTPQALKGGFARISFPKRHNFPRGPNHNHRWEAVGTDSDRAEELRLVFSADDPREFLIVEVHFETFLGKRVLAVLESPAQILVRGRRPDFRGEGFQAALIIGHDQPNRAFAKRLVR